MANKPPLKEVVKPAGNPDTVAPVPEPPIVKTIALIGALIQLVWDAVAGAEVKAMDAFALTLITVVFPALIVLLQPGILPDERFKIVMVVAPAFTKEGIVKDPLPAEVTVMFAVEPDTKFGALKL